MLPNLPSDLDVVVLRPSDRVVRDGPRYQRQFGTDFRICMGRVVAWLRFLKEHNPDYRYITISPVRISALSLDGDVSFPAVVNDAGGEERIDATDLPPPTSRSMVPNIDVITTEAENILQQVCTGFPYLPAYQRPPSGRHLSTRPRGRTGSLPWPSRPSTQRAAPTSMPQGPVPCPWTITLGTFCAFTMAGLAAILAGASSSSAFYATEGCAFRPFLRLEVFRPQGPRP